jgi:Rieske Fe-S protein
MSEVSRRSLIAGVCGIAALSFAPLSAEAASVVRKISNGRLSIKISDMSKVVAVGSSVLVGKVKGQDVGLFRSGPSTFKAFSLRCPHQGAPVIKDETGWYCDVHGSKFEQDGALNMGPATTGLMMVPTKVSRGVLTVG